VENGDVDGLCCGAGGGTMKRLASSSRAVGAQVSGSTAGWPLVASTLVICWRELDDELTSEQARELLSPGGTAAARTLCSPFSLAEKESKTQGVYCKRYTLRSFSLLSPSEEKESKTQGV
jgi:hypothetical protein